MADDRTLAPSPARWHRAWLSGLRPWSGWSWPALACGLVALAIDRMGEGGEPWLDPSPGTARPGAWLGTAAAWLAAVLATAGIAAVALALASQRLGWVSMLEQRRLHAAPARPAVLARLGLCAAVGLLLVLALDGVLAGAARAVDADEAGLATLWLGWAGRATTALAVGLGLGAAVELLLDRRDRGARLWQTPQQARDEVRSAGGRSR
jgi:hypothetical protein